MKFPLYILPNPNLFIYNTHFVVSRTMSETLVKMIFTLFDILYTIYTGWIKIAIAMQGLLFFISTSQYIHTEVLLKDKHLFIYLQGQYPSLMPIEALGKSLHAFWPVSFSFLPSHATYVFYLIYSYITHPLA